MSLYADYVKERENKSIIETEDAFLTYEFFEDFVYIVNLYVRPEKRKSHLASELANEVCKIAKEKGLGVLVGSVDVTARNSTESVKVLLAYGMRVDSVSGNLIYFKKDI
jgi:ribosomal protein S18 acetylase RimI-like enzyme